SFVIGGVLGGCYRDFKSFVIGGVLEGCYRDVCWRYRGELCLRF
uniref:MICOS complex subunit MIC10 n=1 Tax=Caenorhabditis tropicalis TaxID=1561998 RepID=A0A1I7T479_9PELO